MRRPTSIKQMRSVSGGVSRVIEDILRQSEESCRRGGENLKSFCEYGMEA